MTHTQQNTHRDHTSYSMSGVYVRRGHKCKGGLGCGVVGGFDFTKLTGVTRQVVPTGYRVSSLTNPSFLYWDFLSISPPLTPPFPLPFLLLIPYLFPLSPLLPLPLFFPICILYVSSSTSFYNVSLLFTMLFYISTLSTSIYLCLVLGGVGLGGCWVFIAF